MCLTRVGIPICLLLSFPVHSESLFSEASSIDTYLGYSFGSGQGEEQYEYDNEELNYDYDINIHRFSVGFISEKNHRFELSYQRQQLDFGDLYDIGDVRSFDIDGVLALNSGWVVPYVTLGLGFTTYRASGEEIEGGSDLDGFAFNYGAGIIVSLYDTIELDFAYRGNSVSWENLYQGTESEANKLSQQNTQSYPTLGLHLIF